MAFKHSNDVSAVRTGNIPKYLVMIHAPVRHYVLAHRRENRAKQLKLSKYPEKGTSKNASQLNWQALVH